MKHLMSKLPTTLVMSCSLLLPLSHSSLTSRRESMSKHPRKRKERCSTRHEVTQCNTKSWNFAKWRNNGGLPTPIFINQHLFLSPSFPWSHPEYESCKLSPCMGRPTHALWLQHLSFSPLFIPMARTISLHPIQPENLDTHLSLAKLYFPLKNQEHL